MDIKELQELVKVYDDARNDYDEKRRISSKAYEEYKEKEAKIIAAMEENDMDKVFIKGVGTLSTVHKLVYRTPKTPEAKRKLFDHLEEFYGKDFLESIVQINSQTLNKLCNEMTEQGELEIAGLDEPTSVVSLSRRKA